MIGRKAFIRGNPWWRRSPIDNRPGQGNGAPAQGNDSGFHNWGAAMDMHHIRYFLAVCEALSFTRAAEKCNVTQPALSRAIQQPKQEVGGLLFRRERNLTHLT